MRSRVVILGADGFIGRNLAFVLAERADIDLTLVSRGFSRSLIGRLDGRANFVKLDFAQTALVSELCASAHAVINLISGSTPRYTPTGADGEARANVIPQVAFLEQMSRVSKARIIFFSSGGAVYGNPQSLPAAETCATNPISLYGLSKLTIEKHLQLFRATAGLDYTILRLGNVYGPGQSVKRRQGVMAAVLESLFGNRHFTMVGDGANLRDYVFVGDVVEAVEKVLAAGSNVSGAIFNIGSGVGTSVIDIIRMAEMCSGAELVIDRVDASAQEVADIILDVSRAAEAIEWRPRTSFADGMRATFEFFARQHAGVGEPGRIEARIARNWSSRAEPVL